MTSDRPDTSTVRTALRIVDAAERLEQVFVETRVLALTRTLLTVGTDLPPSNLPTVYAVLEDTLGLRYRQDDTDEQVLGYVRLVLEEGRELRPYQRTDVLDALEDKWEASPVGSDDAPDEDES